MKSLIFQHHLRQKVAVLLWNPPQPLTVLWAHAVGTFTDPSSHWVVSFRLPCDTWDYKSDTSRRYDLRLFQKLCRREGGCLSRSLWPQLVKGMRWWLCLRCRLQLAVVWSKGQSGLNPQLRRRAAVAALWSCWCWQDLSTCRPRHRFMACGTGASLPSSVK